MSREYHAGGALLVRKELHTPFGNLYATYRRESGYGTSWWQLDYFVKKPEDYALLELFLQERTYLPDYEAFIAAVRRYGEDGYVVGNTEYSPMNMLIYELLGMERFCLDLADRPERVFGLYEILREKQRRMFEICAGSPAELILYDGNISKEVVGPERFRRYYLPCLNEFAALIHQQEKLIGCHMDASMASLAGAVAESALDVIEAFTPTPTCDMSVAEARQVWSSKVLWINFPSSVHLAGRRGILTEINRILREALPGDRFLVGITEDVPEDAWRNSFKIINQYLRRYGLLPLREQRILGAL
ncbi:MAG: uroporphyrinogen decarboxylase family protein [Spirochaetota bacterium]